MYGHMITKISWMGRSPHFLTHGAALRTLRARDLRYYFAQGIPGYFPPLEIQSGLSRFYSGPVLFNPEVFTFCDKTATFAFQQGEFTSF